MNHCHPLPLAGARRRLLLSLLLCVLVAACSSQPVQTDTLGVEAGAGELPKRINVLPADKATVVAYPVDDGSDPWMGFNRGVYRFNDVSYRTVMIPVASLYNRTPQPMRDSVSRFFANLKSPQLVVNHLLQGDPKTSGSSLLRFVINSTVGIAGLFDPAAAAFDLQPRVTGFADTLSSYGSGRGPFVMLPLLGPANLRSSGGFVVDLLLNPVPYFTRQPATAVISAVDVEQTFAPQAQRYEVLRDQAEDPYRYFRNSFLQEQLRDEQYRAVGNYIHLEP